MTLRIRTNDGEEYSLGAIWEAEITLTGGVPCDEFWAECAYAPQMLPVLRRAVRVCAWENGAKVFFGVVDGFTVTAGPKGAVLRVEGRGMAALLLDNEVEAVQYQRMTTSEIVERYVAPYGVTCAAREEKVCPAFCTEAGQSAWKTVDAFARACGLEARFTPLGELHLEKEAARGKLTVDASANVTQSELTVNRYGVLSEVTEIDRARGTRRTVRSEPFIALGGSCRRVIYLPRGTSVGTGVGEYQIAQSMRQAETLHLTLPIPFAAQPGDCAAVHGGVVGAEGEYTVASVRCVLGAQGEYTELELRKEQGICG